MLSPSGDQEPVNLYEKLIRVFPAVPRRVVISRTPLAPFAPQMAVAAASFSTLISLISSGLIERRVENCSSLSRFSKSTFCTSAGSSKMLPSTTIRGSAEPWMELTPRRRIEVPAPTLPEFATMSRPAIFP